VPAGSGTLGPGAGRDAGLRVRLFTLLTTVRFEIESQEKSAAAKHD